MAHVDANINDSADIPAGPAPLPTVTGRPFYQYHVLPSENHIRRLTLEPGQIDDPLAGSMETIELSEIRSYPYDAISYVWGSEVLDDWILVDGKQLPITTNLAASLRQARHLDTDWAVWADSVCINQADDKEKGHQVRRMGHIYKEAQRTLICLGYHYPQHARVAADLIRDVRAMMDRVFDDPSFSWDPYAFPRLDPDSPLLTPTRWYSLNIMYDHPWFERGWTLQEVALSREALVLWAGLEIPWAKLITVHIWHFRQTKLDLLRRPSHGPSRLHVSYTVRYHGQSLMEVTTLLDRPGQYALTRALTTLETLDWAREFQLTDAKDRIYAFMEMPTSEGFMQALQLEPDYSINTSYLEVYRDFATSYLHKTQDLDLLLYATAAPTAGHSHLDACILPSWVPRWDVGKISKAREFSLSQKMTLNSGSPGFTIHDHASALRVKAIVFDVIAHVQRIVPHKVDGASLEDYAEVVRHVIAGWPDISLKSAKHPGPHLYRLSQAFIQTLCGGMRRGDNDEWGKSVHAFSRLLGTGPADGLVQDYVRDPYAQSIVLWVAIFGRFSMLAIFDRGQFGLAPHAARKGDLCAIVSGTSAPLIIRKVAGDGQYYTVVGAAYIQSQTWNDEIGSPYPLGYAGVAEDWKDLHMPTQEILLC